MRLDRSRLTVAEGFSEELCVQVVQNPLEEEFTVSFEHDPFTYGVFLECIIISECY